MDVKVKIERETGISREGLGALASAIYILLRESAS